MSISDCFVRFTSVRSLCLGLLGLLVATGARAQEPIDEILPLLETQVQGTARAMGMAGAMTAVGGDFSSATLNPAGLALFRRGEVTFSPSLRFASSDARFIGVNASANRTNFGFAQVGVVLANPIFRSRSIGVQNANGVKSYAIALGFVQQNNLWRADAGNAYNPFNSITEAFAGQAQGTANVDQFSAESFAAWRAIAFDTLFNPSAPMGMRQALGYWRPLLDTGNVQQSWDRINRGRVNQWTVAGALNFGDRFYLGATIGILDYNFRSELSFREDDVNRVYQTRPNPWGYTSPRSFEFSEVRTMSGYGVNFRIGMLWQPLDFLRVGASVLTPTAATLTFAQGPEMYLGFYNGDRRPDNSNLQTNEYDFRLTSPWRANGGLTFIFGKRGMLSAEVEYVDYASADYEIKVDNGAAFTRSQTEAMRTFFTSAVNYRIGAEVRPTNRLYVRAGYAMNGTPLSADGAAWRDLATYNQVSGAFQVRSVDRTRISVSGGVGYRNSSWHFDMAVVMQSTRDVSYVHPSYFTPELGYFINSAGTLVSPSFSDGTDANGNGIPFDTITVNGQQVSDGLGLGFEPFIESRLRTLSVVFTLGFTLK